MRHAHAQVACRVLHVGHRKGNCRRLRVFSRRNVRQIRRFSIHKDLRRVVDRMHDNAHAEVRAGFRRILHGIVEDQRIGFRRVEIRIRRKQNALAAVDDARRTVCKPEYLRNRQIFVVRIRRFIDIVVCCYIDSNRRVLVRFRLVVAVSRRIVIRRHGDGDARAGNLAVLIGNRIVERIFAVPVGVRRIAHLVVHNDRGPVGRGCNADDHQAVAIRDVAVFVVFNYVDIRRRIFERCNCIANGHRRIGRTFHDDRDRTDADVVLCVPVVRLHGKGIGAVEVFVRIVGICPVRIDC